MSLLKFEKKNPIILYGYNNEILLENDLVHPMNSNSDSSGIRIKGWDLNQNFIFKLRYKFHKSSNEWNTLIGTIKDYEFYLESNTDNRSIAFRVGNGTNWLKDTYFSAGKAFVEDVIYDIKIEKSSTTFKIYHGEISETIAQIGETTVTGTLADMTNSFPMLGRSHLSHYPIAGSWWTSVGGIYLSKTFVKITT